VLSPLIESYVHRLEAERNLSALTLRNYRTDLAHFFDWLAAEGIDPLAIDRRSFRRYLATLDAADVARASVSRKVSTIHTFYRRLVHDAVLPADPLHGVRPPRPVKRLPRVLQEADAQAVVEAPSGDGPLALRDRALLELLYGAGVRVSELAGLDVRDVDLEEETLRVTGKGNKQRLVVFGGPAARAMHAYLRDGRPRLAGGRPEPALLLNRD